jgi:hypothetical protein
MPLSDERGMYAMDPDGLEVATWHTIPYLRNEAIAVIDDHKLKLSNVLKRDYVMFA